MAAAGQRLRLANRNGDKADLIARLEPAGALQVPGDGLPLMLIADRQTAGGYPKIATVAMPSDKISWPRKCGSFGPSRRKPMRSELRPTV